MNGKSKGVKRSATWADVTSARKRGMKEMLEIVTYALTSKQGFEKDGIDLLMQNVAYVMESVAEGRVNMRDIRETVKDEVRVVFITEK